MTYDVLKDFDDVVKYPIEGSKETRDVTVLSLKAGEKFIPAETHYPQNKVDALVANGTIKLVEKAKPAPPAIKVPDTFGPPPDGTQPLPRHAVAGNVASPFTPPVTFEVAPEPLPAPAAPIFHPSPPPEPEPAPAPAPAVAEKPPIV